MLLRRRSLPPSPRTTLVAFGAVALALVGACSEPARREAQPRDVVLVVVEGLRGDTFPAADGAAIAIPALQRLAGDSVVHVRATSPATWCVPASASLLTGRWPSYHGAERVGGGDADVALPIDAGAATLAEVLAAAGWRTAAFVGSPALRREIGFARGFSEFESDPARARGPGLGAAVAAWLGRHPERSFLFVSVAGIEVAGDGAGAARGEAARDAYARGAAAADRSLGDVLEALRAAGRYDDALVVVTADHGEMLGEHGLFGHGRPPFEPQVHVPLLVKYPGGRRAGEWVDRRVSTLGVFATILDAVGVAVPAGAQSRSLDLLHPVWVEDVDASGARVRAGYDGPDVKLISLASDAADVACLFVLSEDPREARPNCNADAATPLRTALASFSRRDRPPRAPTALVPGPRSSVGPDVARADR